MKIKFENKEIDIDLWIKYLYPYLLRFSIKKDIGVEWKNDSILISNQHREDFTVLLEHIFAELLEECYTEPTQRQRTKNSSRYRKIEFKGKVYILNYRTDIVGIIGYGLDYLITESKKEN